MLTQCIASGRLDNIKPKRWRLQEWHDHLMAETWKITNPNIDLPQKLFLEPIKVTIRNTQSLYLNTDLCYIVSSNRMTHTNLLRGAVPYVTALVVDMGMQKESRR